MKLSITNPEILDTLCDLPGGLWPVRRTDRMILVVKAPGQMALAAKRKCAFHVYLVPLRADGIPTFGLLTAFFDDHDEPLTIRKPLFREEIIQDFLMLLSSPIFYVHFFDDHDRELAAFRAENPSAIRFQLLSSTVRFVPPTLDVARQFQDDMQFWFGNRSPEDDKAAFTVHLRESLFPHRLGDHIDNPGTFNEADIAAALHGAFGIDYVFTNPLRADNRRELADVLVATPNTLLLVQAKDSPNTESSISRDLSRKRATTHKHVKKAARQLSGSINQLRTRDSFDIIIDGKHRTISTSGRRIVGLVIVRELFEPDRPECSLPILDMFETTEAPCVLLDYLEFRQLTFVQSTEDGFVTTLSDIFSAANQLHQFPPSRFGFRSDRSVVYRPRPSADAPTSSTDQTHRFLPRDHIVTVPPPGPHPLSRPDAQDLHLILGSEPLHVMIDRAHVEALDVTPTARFLSRILADRDTIERCRGRLEIAFAGYTHDQRELYEIPDVRRFCTELDEAFPYWFYFLSTETATLRVIAACLCSTTSAMPGFVRFGPDLVDFLEAHFDALNWLVDNYSLDESDNVAVSRSVAEYFNDFEPYRQSGTPA